MLREQDYKRIKKEIDAVGGDAVEYLRARSPWRNPLEPAVLRVSQLLKELGVIHVLCGPRALPLYGVPHLWGGILFAVRGLKEIAERVSSGGFLRVPGRGGGVKLLDRVENVFVELLPEPRPLQWSDELVGRIIERHGIRALGVEDYAVAMLLSEGRALGEELAAKVLYANLKDVDEKYLLRRAEEHGVLGEVGELLRALREL